MGVKMSREELALHGIAAVGSGPEASPIPHPAPLRCACTTCVHSTTPIRYAWRF